MKKLSALFLFATALAFADGPPFVQYATPLGGGSSGCDSACQSAITFPGLGEGTLYKSAGGPISNIDPGTTGQVLQSRGVGLKPQFTNPAAISAFITGSTLVSNPVLTNPAARFGLVEKTPGISSYAGITSGTTTRLNRWAYGAGLYVVVGVGGLIRTSPDLVTWTARTSGVAVEIRSILWSGAQFVAVGLSGTVVTSADGITWASHNIGTADDLYSIAYNGTRYVVGAVSAHTYWSTTATSSSWTQVTLPAGAQHTVSSIAWSPVHSLFICGTETASSGIFSSPTGSVWTSRQSGVSGTFISIAQDSATIIAVGGSGRIYRSVNGTAWTNVSTGSATYRVFFGNDAFHIVGTSGASLISYDDGVTWVAGASTGVTSDLRFGLSDPNNTTHAIVIGDSGVIREGKYSFRSIIYASAAARDAMTSPLDSVDNTYSSTPTVVDIPSQISFNVAILVPANLPLTFDVVSISDIIYSLFVAQNMSLPQPYFGYNSVFDFDADMRFEYGLGSSNQYAGLQRYSGTTGKMRFLGSHGVGNAGSPITWDTLAILDTNQNLSVGTSAVAPGTKSVNVGGSYYKAGVLIDTASTATVTFTGCSAGTTGTANFSRSGGNIVWQIPALSCTSNSTATTVTGMPLSYAPAATTLCLIRTVQDNTTTTVDGVASIATTGVITISLKTQAALVQTVSPTFTASNTKSISTFTCSGVR